MESEKSVAAKSDTMNFMAKLSVGADQHFPSERKTGKALTICIN